MTSLPDTQPRHCVRCEGEFPADQTVCPMCGIDLVTDDEWQAYLEGRSEQDEQRLLADLRSLGVLESLTEQRQQALADSVQETRDLLLLSDGERADFEYQRLAPAVHRSLERLRVAMMAAWRAVDAVRRAAEDIPEPAERGLLRFQAAVLRNCDEAKQRLGLFPLGEAPPVTNDKKPRPTETLNYCRKRLVNLLQSWDLGTPEAHQRTRRIEIACWPRRSDELRGHEAAMNSRITPAVGDDGLVEAYKVAFRREKTRAARNV